MTITLQELMDTARESARQRSRRMPEAELEARLRSREIPPSGRFRDALRGSGVALIAEVKGASPVDGTLRAGLEPVEVARGYENAGAAAVSVLTEEHHFGGALEHLEGVARSISLPVLRKDFVSQRYQVLEAALGGAAAVLLIAEALTGERLAELVAEAQAVGLDALVEVHGAAGIDRAVAAGSGLVGVNNRDLESMRVDPTHALAVADRLPRDCVTVAESGVRSRAQVVAAGEAGYDAVLVGSSLMTAPDPQAALRRLLGRERG